MQRILFLDFDGVLHPQHDSHVNPFGYMDNFCNVLREADPRGKLTLVISSSWRIQETIEELRAHFPQDIAARILDRTPNLVSANSSLKGSRQREITAWMAQYAPNGAWLALDDKEEIFEIDCPHLFLIDEDFTQAQAPEQGDFSLMAEIEKRERLTALWQSRGLGINLRVAENLRCRLKVFVESTPTDATTS